MEAMKEKGVYVIVQHVGDGVDMSKLDLISDAGDHVTNMKIEARQLVPQKVPPTEGPVLGLVVRVEAVIVFRPELVVVAAASRPQDATNGPTPQPHELPVTGGPTA